MTKLMSVPTTIEIQKLDMVLRELAEPVPLPKVWANYTKQWFARRRAVWRRG